VCVQDETYAERFVKLGAARERVMVTGTMKFDTAEVGEGVAGDVELGREVGLVGGKDKETRGQVDKGTGEVAGRLPSGPVWVCGSTGPGEEEMVLGVYRRLRERFAGLRLVIVPRKPERFDEVAEMIGREGFEFARRSETVGKAAARLSEPRRNLGGSSEHSQPATLDLQPVILGDTMGELRKFYSLADVVFVGRSLVDLGPRQHGSDMIEPAALGRPVVVGPYTGNFADAMMKLRAAGAVREVADAEELEREVGELLGAPAGARAMGLRGREVVQREQGATDRHVGVVMEVLGG
jgi:3-deoxy-D-manno-octulosonic-acid transferase